MGTSVCTRIRIEFDQVAQQLIDFFINFLAGVGKATITVNAALVTLGGFVSCKSLIYTVNNPRAVFSILNAPRIAGKIRDGDIGTVTGIPSAS